RPSPTRRSSDLSPVCEDSPPQSAGGGPAHPPAAPRPGSARDRRNAGGGPAHPPTAPCKGSARDRPNPVRGLSAPDRFCEGRARADRRRRRSGIVSRLRRCKTAAARLSGQFTQGTSSAVIGSLPATGGCCACSGGAELGGASPGGAEDGGADGLNTADEVPCVN